MPCTELLCRTHSNHCKQYSNVQRSLRSIQSHTPRQTTQRTLFLTPAGRAPHRPPPTMSDLDTFTFLPLHMDPQSKTISAAPSSRALDAELEALNTLHRSLRSLEAPHVVPPPP